METVYCGYNLNLETRNSYFSGLPSAVFNFSVKWHHQLVFVDQVGAPISFQDTTLSELSQSLELPRRILPWQSLCQTSMERVLDALDVRIGFWADIIRSIMRVVSLGSYYGHQHFDMSIDFDLVTPEQVEMEDIGGKFSLEDTCQIPIKIKSCGASQETQLTSSRGTVTLSRTTTENEAEIPCSHLFHSRCVVKFFGENDLCPLCHSKVEVEDPEKFVLVYKISTK